MDEKSAPSAVAIPRYWAPEKEVAERLDISANTAQLRAEPYSTLSSTWLAIHSQTDHPRNGRENRDLRHDPACSVRSLRSKAPVWLVRPRDISSPTNQRTSILAAIRGTAVSNKAPLIDIDYKSWLQAPRGITNSTNERTLLSDNFSFSGVGNSAPILSYQNARAVASALVLGNMNSIPLDWAARFSVGCANRNFFIVRQLPVLPPDTYLKEGSTGHPYVHLSIPRVLELTYTSEKMEDFAVDLDFDGRPFPWDEERRHCLRCELDAIFAQMHGLTRSDLEWILDARAPSLSFPSLKQNEMRSFGEYRTQRYVLQALDSLEHGQIPNLNG